MRRTPCRLGVYQDGPFRIVGDEFERRLFPVSSDRAFLRFAGEVGRSFDQTVVFARAQYVSDAGADEPLGLDIGFVELPYYESLADATQVARAAPGTLRGFWRGLSRVDAVWVLGPHPFSLALIVLAILRRKRVVLGVRQDTVAYFRSRLPSGRAGPAVLAVRLWDMGYRLFGRRLATVVVGSELERQYGGPRRGLLTINVSQIRDSDVVSSPLPRDWSGTIRLLTVGRIDREKNPLLLVDVVAQLCEAEHDRYSLTWVGAGPLADDVQRRADELGVHDRIELLGFVPFGPRVLDLYRTSHIFVHVSLTEGVPATLIEALGSGTPVVATGVGGVPAALEHGKAGLLVPPEDRDALVRAISRLADDRDLWEHLASHGLTMAAERTLDSSAARVAQFVKLGDQG